MCIFECVWRHYRARAIAQIHNRLDDAISIPPALWYDIARYWDEEHYDDSHFTIKRRSGKEYVNGYDLWVGIGAALGVWRVARTAPQRQSGLWMNIALLVLLSSLLGARLFYNWINWPYFKQHPAEIPQIWLGGLSWPGAIGGAFIMLLGISLIFRGPHGSRVSLGWMADHLYPLLPPLSITTWLGCWVSGIAYGPVLPPGTWWGILSPDESGAYQLHWPLQPLAAFSLIIFFWLLDEHVKPLRPPGRLSSLAAIGLAINLLVTSLLRADPSPVWDGMPIHTWMAVVYLVVFSCIGIASLVIRVLKRMSLSRQDQTM